MNELNLLFHPVFQFLLPPKMGKKLCIFTRFCDLSFLTRIRKIDELLLCKFAQIGANIAKLAANVRKVTSARLCVRLDFCLTKLKFLNNGEQKFIFFHDFHALFGQHFFG